MTNDEIYDEDGMLNNDFALLNYDMDNMLPTEDFIKQTKEIKNHINWFIGELNLGEDLKLSAWELKDRLETSEKRYNGGVGDTATDECIADFLEQRLKECGKSKDEARDISDKTHDIIHYGCLYKDPRK